MQARPLGPLAAALLLSACATASPVGDGRWFGTATPDPAKPGCVPSRPSLQLRDKEVLFTPDEGTWTLIGIAKADGSIGAERAGAGANKQAYATSFVGKAAGDSIAGTYVTPHCSFRVALQRR